TLLLLPILMILSTTPLKKRLLKIENKFMDNLNERELRRSGKKNNLVHNMHIAQMDVKDGCKFIGKRLGDANIRKLYGVNIISIKRGVKRIDVPKSDSRIFPGDMISVVGTDQQIQNFLSIVEVEEIPDEVKNNIHFELGHYLISENSMLAGKSITESQFRQNNCLVVGIETEEGDFINVSGETLLNSGDTIWLVGDKHVMETLAK
ncbi:MAG: TrkA C-terminal domain-containing protein, partial [Bacteroidales bacterium]